MIDNESRLLYSHFNGQDDITERIRYKYFTENDANILKIKTDVLKSITHRGLTSLMNDTKWLKLHEAIETLPFAPAYIEKTLLYETSCDEDKFSATVPTHFGNWSPFYKEGMSLFFTIEWLKINPRYAKYQGRLVNPRIIDESEEFELILKQLLIPYEYSGSIYTIFGYK